MLSDIMNTYAKEGRTIIFCETKKEANEIASKTNIIKEIDVIHGDISQIKR